MPRVSLIWQLSDSWTRSTLEGLEHGGVLLCWTVTLILGWSRSEKSRSEVPQHKEFPGWRRRTHAIISKFPWSFYTPLAFANVAETLHHPVRLRKVVQGLYESCANILIVRRESYDFWVIRRIKKLLVGFVKGCEIIWENCLECTKLTLFCEMQRKLSKGVYMIHNLFILHTNCCKKFLLAGCRQL